MRGFVKLYGTVLESSLWDEDPLVRLTFLTMLVMADVDGFVEAVDTGVARRANLPVEDVIEALRKLEEPDERSKNPAEDGKRIIRVERGWKITNYKWYREFRTEEQQLAADRQRRHRSKPRVAESEVDESAS